MDSKSGIYFLIKDNKIIYIGKTTDYPNRPFFHHHITKNEYDKVKFLEYKKEDLDRFERAYIQKYRPFLNKALKSEPRTKCKKYIKKQRMILRKLTKKAKIGFGKYRYQTVGNLLAANKKLDLIAIYYKLSHINFMDDVLDELGIIPEYRIAKPGSDKDKYYEFAHKFYPEAMERRKKICQMHYYDKSKNTLKILHSVNNDKAFLLSKNRK